MSYPSIASSPSSSSMFTAISPTTKLSSDMSTGDYEDPEPEPEPYSLPVAAVSVQDMSDGTPMDHSSLDYPTQSSTVAGSGCNDRLDRLETLVRRIDGMVHATLHPQSSTFMIADRSMLKKFIMLAAAVLLLGAAAGWLHYLSHQKLQGVLQKCSTLLSSHGQTLGNQLSIFDSPHPASLSPSPSLSSLTSAAGL